MRQHLDADLLRAFVMVAETNSFTKASERLFRTQAAVSLQIKRLEERIGKSLFLRSARGVRLTDDGELLMHYARGILHLNDEAFSNLSVLRPEDVVRIGARDDHATILLPTILVTFNRAFPQVQIEVTCDHSVNLVREVRDRRLDLALVTCRQESRDGELIRSEPLHWITSADNSPHTSDPLPLALFPNGCVCREIALRMLTDMHRSWKVLFASGTISAVRAAVSAGLAVGVAEESAIPAGMRRLGEADGFPSLGTVDIVLYRSPGRQRRPAAALAEHIRLWLMTPPPTRPECSTEHSAPIGQSLTLVARSPALAHAPSQHDASVVAEGPPQQSREPPPLAAGAQE